MLKPLSQVLGYSTLDVDCANFHYGEDFLEMVTLAIAKLFKELVIKFATGEATTIMHRVKRYSPLYELLYMYIWHLCPYWHT